MSTTASRGRRLLVIAGLCALVVPLLMARPGRTAAAPLACEAGDVMVTVRSNFFQPSTVSVMAGGTVCWTVQGLSSHTVTADDSSFDSGSLPPGQTFRVTFTQPGIFGYHCIFHPPGMVGTVRVLPKKSS